VALPRHALKEALPPVPNQGLIAASCACNGFNSSSKVQAAEPQRVRDAAEAPSRGLPPLLFLILNFYFIL
jgi:hypothetical protein